MSPPPTGGAVVAKNHAADVNFVKKNLLHIKPQGCEDYGQAFRDAVELVNRRKDTVMIFLTDGASNDNGAKDIVKKLKREMEDQLALFCMTLGQDTCAIVKAIAKAGGTEDKRVWSGQELGMPASILIEYRFLSIFNLLRNEFQEYCQTDEFWCIWKVLIRRGSQ